MECTAKTLDSNINTLERSYGNHLRDKLGYTGDLDISRIDRQRLYDALSCLAATERAIETNSTRKRLVAELEPQKKDRMDTYAMCVARSRKTAAQIIEALGKLPDGYSGQRAGAVEDIGILCKNLTRDVNNIEWAIHTHNTIEYQISQYSKTVRDDKPDLYRATKSLLYSMGLSEPEKVGVLEDLSRTINLDRLEIVKQSAKYLLKKLSGRRPDEKFPIKHLVSQGCVI